MAELELECREPAHHAPSESISSFNPMAILGPRPLRCTHEEMGSEKWCHLPWGTQLGPELHGLSDFRAHHTLPWDDSREGNTIPLLKMEKLRPKESKTLARGHAGTDAESQG